MPIYQSGAHQGHHCQMLTNLEFNFGLYRNRERARRAAIMTGHTQEGIARRGGSSRNGCCRGGAFLIYLAINAHRAFAIDTSLQMFRGPLIKSLAEKRSKPRYVHDPNTLCLQCFWELRRCKISDRGWRASWKSA